MLATVAYFLPILFVIFRKLWKDSYFLYLAIYWTAGAVVNSVTNIPGLSSSTLETIIVSYNMIDIPFILWILWYTSFSSNLAQVLKYIIIIYIVIELILIFSLGLTYDAIKYIMGVGVLIVLASLIWEIRFYLQQLEHSNREKAMLFIYAALLFEYASYICIYIFEYFVPADPADTLLIYYISTIIGISIACFGFSIKKNKESIAYK